MKNLRLIINNDKKGNEKEKFFIKKELQCILNLYAKMVSNGSWKDYAFSSGSREVSFDVYQRSSDKPFLRITKNLKPNYLNDVLDHGSAKVTPIAKELLEETHPDLKIPDAGFYLWLPVKDDLKVTRDLWRNYSVRVMPGTFMAENVSGENPCKGFLRIALVHKKEIVTEALQRISNYFKNNHV